MKLNKRRLQQIIKEELVKVLQEELPGRFGSYQVEHPSGLGYELGVVDDEENIIGSSHEYTNQELRRPEGFIDREDEAELLSMPGFGYDRPWTDAAERPAFGHTPIRPETTWDADMGIPGLPGRGVNQPPDVSRTGPEVPWWELGDDDSKYGSGGGA